MTIPVELVAPARCDATASAQPLKRGDACTVVIFGAAGDLAKRKLFPALFHLQCDGLLHEDFALVGVARSPMTDDAFRRLVYESARDADDPSPAGEIDDEAWGRLAPRLSYVQGDFTAGATYASLGDRLGAIEAGRRHSDGHHPPGAERSRGADQPTVGPAMGTGGDRKAVRDRPREREGAQPHRSEVVRGASGLSHRPLPRQGDGAEPDGLPVREFHLRAGVESPPHPPRADHRRRDRRGRAPRGLLREHRRGARHVPEPPAPAHVPDGHGAAGGPSGRRRSGREDQGPPRHPPPPGRPVAQIFVAGAVWAGHRRGRGGAGLPAGARRRTGVGYADLGRPPAPGGQLALAGGAVLPPLGQANAPAGDRDRGAVPGTAPPDVPAGARPDDHAQRYRHPGAAPGGNLARVRHQGAGGRRPDDGGPDGFSYAEAFGAAAHSAYETLLLDCMVGGATLFTRGDAVEAAWELVDPVIEAWHDRDTRHFPNYAAGSWGPATADKFIARDGARWRQP